MIASDSCTIGDYCDSYGACAPGPEIDYSGLTNSCNVGYCAYGYKLLADPQLGSCDDGNDCTVRDTCNGYGVCKGFMDCSALDGPCHSGY
jgi:hypothetical protein